MMEEATRTGSFFMIMLTREGSNAVKSTTILVANIEERNKESERECGKSWQFYFWDCHFFLYKRKVEESKKFKREH